MKSLENARHRSWKKEQKKDRSSPDEGVRFDSGIPGG